MIDTVLAKENIQARFSLAATTYDAAAVIQRQVADRLSLKFKELSPHLPDGPILELGCGTGLMSRHIIALAPDRPLYLTDLSPAMLEQCRTNIAALKGRMNLEFHCLDADELDYKDHFAAVVSSFSFQWFAQPENCLKRMLDSLRAGGYLLLSYPTGGSFPEWRQICQRNNQPFSGNLLPEADYLSRFAQGNVLESWCELEAKSTAHESALSFFESLRSAGAHLALKGAGRPVDLLKVVRHWDRQSPGRVTATYEICYGWIKKGGKRP